MPLPYRYYKVEIKSFVGASEMNELEKAIGQYIVYHNEGWVLSIKSL